MTKQDLKSIGETLKQRRKELHLSLLEAENATSIRMVYLQAIEEGETSKLISPVYAQGFMKQYAGLLGIDGDRIMRENPELFHKMEQQEFSYGIGTLEIRGNPSAGVKWFPSALWIIIFIALLFSAWYIARFFEVI
jgi:cytoskeletal protein RodZ